MTEESSQKQTGVLTGKRKRLEDEEVDEDNEFRRVTRAMSEPDWVKKVMNRMDRVTDRMESFTDRVEKLERRLMDREKLEKKWRNDVGKQIENVEDLGYGHIENVKTVWKVIKKLERTTEKLEGTVEKLRVAVEEWSTDEDEGKKTEDEQDAEGDEEMAGETEEKVEATEGTEKKTEETEEVNEEEDLDETLKGDVEMMEG
jgi:hypothetical protein